MMADETKRFAKIIWNGRSCASTAIAAREGAIREAAKVVTDRANAIHAIRIDAGELAGPYLKECENECDLLESAILSLIPTQEGRDDD